MRRRLTSSQNVWEKTEVVMFQRRPLAGQYSVERVFADIRAVLPSDVAVIVHVLPFESRGVLRRILNMAFAWRHRGKINHVAGDVHYLALALPRRGTILTVLDLVGVGRSKGLRRALLVLIWYRLPVWRCERVTVISDWTRTELLALLPKALSKTVVVHCPVSPIFRSSRPPTTCPPVVLQVGTGTNKNLFRVIHAVAGLGVHLRIVGALGALHLDALTTASVVFSQVAAISDEDLAAEYVSAYVVLFVSTYEGFGLPILEAQASGRPVVTSSVASMPEVAGSGALLVDPTDEVQIRGALSLLIDDVGVYDKLVSRGFENVANFSAQSIAAAYAKMYRELAAS